MKEDALIRLMRSIKLNEEFKIPIPTKNEDENTYMERCMLITSKEFPHEQAVAICQKQWAERN